MEGHLLETFAPRVPPKDPAVAAPAAEERADPVARRKSAGMAHRFIPSCTRYPASGTARWQYVSGRLPGPRGPEVAMLGPHIP
jgi:hypothetical protein